MPLSPLKFRPGINRDVTSYTNEGGWVDCDKIRFRLGYPEKMGNPPTWLAGLRRVKLLFLFLSHTIYS